VFLRWALESLEAILETNEVSKANPGHEGTFSTDNEREWSEESYPQAHLTANNQQAAVLGNSQSV
jgi:hypothetical protein